VRKRGAGWPARFQRALPLLVVYFALAAIYAWQASKRPVPTLFTDELEFTQLSRAIAATGEAARRGVPYGLAPIGAYLLAPVWWLGSVSAAYATLKLVLVLAMTATIFPAYGLARLVVPPWYALAAAAGATAVPALAYAPFLVREPLAYPLSTLALWLIARLLASPSWKRLILAVLACAAGALARTQLAVLFAILVAGLLWIAWRSERIQRWRAGWSSWDWVGALTLLVGAVLAFSALMGHLSTSWRNTTGFYKDRIFHNGVWAAGALAIGIGILPVVAGISALARPKGERRDPETRAFVATSVAALAAFLWYTGIKGAYIQNTFATVVAERDLIYLCPVLFAATALAIVRGVGRGWAIAGAAIFTAYVVHGAPLELDHYPYYEAHGLAIAAFANRKLGWAQGTIEHRLLLVCLLALGVVVALRWIRRGSTAYWAVAGVAAAVVLVWSMTAEVYAANSERIASDQMARNLTRPFNWLDQATGDSSVVVLGQQIVDPTGIWLTEFWNRSVKKMWSLDGTAINVGGPILTPDLASPNGTLSPSPDTKYALALNGIELDAPIVARRPNETVYRLDGKPIKLAGALTGVYGDGWMAGQASYTRYDVSHDGPGFAIFKLSRVASCGKDFPAKATIKLGPVKVGPDKEPAIAHVTATQTKTLHQCIAKGFALPVPNAPWRAEIAVTPTFSPQDVNPKSSDRRQLGAVITEAGFQPLFGG
jgi:hypothetical protein